MITLYAFGRVHPGMVGKARDLRAQWALEETGLPYRVHALDYLAGELDAPAYGQTCMAAHAGLLRRAAGRGGGGHWLRIRAATEQVEPEPPRGAA